MSKSRRKFKPVFQPVKLSHTKIKIDEVNKKTSMEVTAKEALLIFLAKQRAQIGSFISNWVEDNDEDDKQPERTKFYLEAIEEMGIDIDYLENHLKTLSLIPGKTFKDTQFKSTFDTDEEGDRIKKIFRKWYVGLAVAEILNKRDEYLNYKEDELPPELRDEKINKFRRSGHLTDQILKYNYPKDHKRKELTLFDNLKEETKDKIDTLKVEKSTLVEGIKLSPSEHKVIDSLSKLLHSKSQNLDPKEDGYYSGNMDSQAVTFGGQNMKATKLAFTIYELTKEYKGGEAISGKDVDNVKLILRELQDKKFLISYIENTIREDGTRKERKMEGFESLINILKLSETEFNKADIEISKKEDTIILLHPIFNHQIDSKYIQYPEDINKRTLIAYGSHNVSETTLRLREYLARELSSKRYSPEIGMDRLYWLLNEKWMKQSRKKKVREYTMKAIATVKALGLLESYEITQGKTGEDKIVFKLNKDWK